MRLLRSVAGVAPSARCPDRAVPWQGAVVSNGADPALLGGQNIGVPSSGQATATSIAASGPMMSAGWPRNVIIANRHAAPLAPRCENLPIGDEYRFVNGPAKSLPGRVFTCLYREGRGGIMRESEGIETPQPGMSSESTWSKHREPDIRNVEAEGSSPFTSTKESPGQRTEGGSPLTLSQWAQSSGSTACRSGCW